MKLESYFLTVEQEQRGKTERSDKYVTKHRKRFNWQRRKTGV